MKLENDARPIESITTSGDAYWCAGHNNVTAIKLYFEDGQMARVPWLAVFVQNQIAHRVNMALVESIGYEIQSCTCNLTPCECPF